MAKVNPKSQGDSQTPSWVCSLCHRIQLTPLFFFSFGLLPVPMLVSNILVHILALISPPQIIQGGTHPPMALITLRESCSLKELRKEVLLRWVWVEE